MLKVALGTTCLEFIGICVLTEQELKLGHTQQEAGTVPVPGCQVGEGLRLSPVPHAAPVILCPFKRSDAAASRAWLRPFWGAF